MAGGLDSNVTLLLHCDGANGGTTFPDSGPNARTIAQIGAGNATTSNTQSKFGGTSASFNGTNTALADTTVADGALTGDFTIDLWVYMNALPGGANYSLVDRTGATQYSWGLFVIGATNKCAWYFSSDGTVGGNTAISSTSTLAANIWTHIAVQRAGNSITLFVNGVQDATGSETVNPFNNLNRINIGARQDGGPDSFLNGFIDELRISSVARYTQGNFTPPTGPYDGWQPGARRIRNLIDHRS